MVKQLSCLKRKTYLTIGLNVANVFLGGKISLFGNNKNGYVKGPKGSFGEKCTKTPYVKGKSSQITIFNHWFLTSDYNILGLLTFFIYLSNL
jgi:hypothetical protein